jgi:hypothetical protein
MFLFFLPPIILQLIYCTHTYNIFVHFLDLFIIIIFKALLAVLMFIIYVYFLFPFTFFLLFKLYLLPFCVKKKKI